MHEKYEELVNELKKEVEINVRYGGDISWAINLMVEELDKDELLEILRSVAAKFIEREIRGSI